MIESGWCPICQQPLNAETLHNGRCFIHVLNRIEHLYKKIEELKVTTDEMRELANLYRYTQPPTSLGLNPLASSDKPRTTRGELMADPSKPIEGIG